MSDLQTAVEFLTEELQHTREELSLAYAEKAALADICRGYHEILFGVPIHEDLSKVLRAVALGFAASWEVEKPQAKNFVTQDVCVDGPKPLRLNITVQRVEGKSPYEELGELREAIKALITTVALYNPTLASRLRVCHAFEIPILLKNVALGADRS